MVLTNSFSLAFFEVFAFSFRGWISQVFALSFRLQHLREANIDFGSLFKLFKKQLLFQIGTNNFLVVHVSQLSV